jgi:hypothetical protein
MRSDREPSSWHQSDGEERGGWVLVLALALPFAASQTIPSRMKIVGTISHGVFVMPSTTKTIPQETTKALQSLV